MVGLRSGFLAELLTLVSVYFGWSRLSWKTARRNRRDDGGLRNTELRVGARQSTRIIVDRYLNCSRTPINIEQLGMPRPYESITPSPRSTFRSIGAGTPSQFPPLRRGEVGFVGGSDLRAPAQAHPRLSCEESDSACSICLPCLLCAGFRTGELVGVLSPAPQSTCRSISAAARVVQTLTT